jgi:ribosomal-protein-alanine N-acetyltransferase
MVSIRRLLFGPPREGEPRPGHGRSAPGVRAMRPEDLEDVLRIEAASAPDAWTAAVFDYWLGKARASGHVLERGGERVGFFIVVRAADHLHVANLAVAPEARRTGVGTLALQAIENIARAHGLPRVELEVRDTNLAAQLLYRRNGYRAVEILRSYYGDQDAYKMTKVVSAPRPARH